MMSTSIPTEAREAAYERFLRDYPEYRKTSDVDTLRRREFSRLDRSRHIYLDYTGGGLYGESQIDRHMDMLRNQVFGNPHSTNPTSQRTTELIENTRRRVLEFFNASADEYGVIFTSNASTALKLVGESYPFEPGDRLLLTFDNHNSVNGIREFDRARGAKTSYIPVEPPDMRVPEEALKLLLEQGEPNRHNLFAFPAQSNFSGV
ncbi:MAG: aminotransferase class V-fold PLP-dependent enzyme, partial [Acidobacteriota bacterium]